VVSWAWDFGDGSTSSERNPSHTYAAAGRYTVLLVATDDGGAADSTPHDANPTAPPTANEPPRADFDVHCDHESCEFGDKSTDADGTVVAWQWSFGDGATATEQNPTHTYPGRGRYDVQLTVTDDGGATASKTKRVDIKH
jgi:PKD repeat protein